MARLYFAAVVLVALTLGPSLAHLLELPNKIGMAAEDYLTVQQIYRGWAWFGAVLLSALAAILVVAVRTRHTPRPFRLALLAAICLAAMLGVFFVFTYPANLATENWTFLPRDWEALRARWEYSHAVSALLNFLALLSLLGSLFAARQNSYQAPRGVRRS
jgi:hypothetical protein